LIKENLEIIRKFIGISQRELGRRIGMSGQYIAKIEKGERAPTIETLTKISNALEIELNELLERPKFSRELFFDTIEEKQISYEQLKNDCHLLDISIKTILCDNKGYFLDDYYSIGMYLGSSKKFLEKRQELDSKIRKLLSDDDYEKYIEKLLKRYYAWCNLPTLNSKEIHQEFIDYLNNHEENHKTDIPENIKINKVQYNERGKDALYELLVVLTALDLNKYSGLELTTKQFNDLYKFALTSIRVKLEEIIEHNREGE
jgi:transcriptional regulator with XRE-family HTH domain